MNTLQQNHINKFLDINKVSHICSLGKSTILLWESQGRFPKAVRLSKTKRVWLESDINDWVIKMHLASQTFEENFNG
jgi:predicted DNA-binding transcriptional regulator AlpA